MRFLIYPTLFCCLWALVSGCASGRAFSAGEKFEQEGRYEEAMLSYAAAYRSDPESFESRMRFLRAREKAALKRFQKGMEEYDKGEYAAALTDFQVAYGLDPSQERTKQMAALATQKKDARQAYREGQEFEKDNKLKYANLCYNRAVELDPEQTQYRAAQARINALLNNAPNGYDLNIRSTKPFAFKFYGAGLKEVMRVLTQLSGINFLFDEGVKDQPVNINMDKTNFRQVLDLLTTMNKLGSSILNENTVLIYPKTPEKTKQYEEMKMRTFRLSYMNAAKAVNLIRTVLPARKIHVNEESNSIVVRDSSEVIAVIEKLLDANDVPEAEVLLDVEIMELNETDSKNVGLALSRYAVDLGAFDLSSGKLLADSLIGSDSTTTNAGVDQLAQVFSWNGYGGFVTVPSATFNFSKTMANGELLANPKIRVKNKEKAKFTVGTRQPITTTSTTGTTSGYAVNVQYIDVGVKVNAEPTIGANNEIDIKLSLEVSSVLKIDTLGDGITTVATIGTRNLDTVLSLKDGETSVIGGLIQRLNTDTKSKIYLLSDIPLVGPFLTGNQDKKEKTEIILAITPRLVRGVMLPPLGIASFMSGREDSPSLNSGRVRTDQDLELEALPKKSARPQAPPPMGAQPAIAPAAPRQINGELPPPPVTEPLRGTDPQLSGAQPEIPQPDPVTSPIPPMPESVSPPAVPAPGAAMRRGQIQVVGPPGGSQGEQFTLEIRAVDVEGLVDAPFVLVYDPNLVEPVSFAEGAFLKTTGLPATFWNTVDASGGSASITLSLPAGSPGVSGSGVLATAVFQAKKRGTATFGFRNVGFKTAGGASLTVVPVTASVTIR